MDATAILQYLDFAHDSGRGNRTSGDHHVEPCAARALRPTSRNRALDLSALAVRLSHRSRNLFHAVSLVRGVETSFSKDAIQYLRQAEASQGQVLVHDVNVSAVICFVDAAAVIQPYLLGEAK